jgi:beta-lactamase class A
MGRPAFLALAMCFFLSACVPPRGTAQATVGPTRGPVAQPVVQPAQDLQLASVLANVQADTPDTYGLIVEDLRSGARSTLNEDRIFASGSVYKLALAWEVLRRVDVGQLELDKPLPIEPEDAMEPEPEGGFGPGETPSIREAVGAMLSVSSNSAAHAFLRVLGRNTFNTAMGRLGLASTRVPESAAEDASDLAEAVTSPRDIGRLLRLMASRQGLSAASYDELHAALAVGGTPDALRDTLPSEVTILDKTGNLDQASNVGALLLTPRSTVVLVVLDEGVDPGDARAVIAQLGQAAYDAYLRAND